MKALQIILILLCSYNSLFSQTILHELKDFYNKADFAWYERRIQEDLHTYDSLINKFSPILGSSPHLPIRPANIDLSKQNKRFAMALSLYNTETYDFEDDIYDYIILDSLRTFIIICVDDKSNVIGYTDTEEPGSYVDITDGFYYPDRAQRRRIRNSIKNIDKEEPEILLYCNSLWGSLMYLKENKLYVYDLKAGRSVELNDYVRSFHNINTIRRSNGIMWPMFKAIETEESHPITYRLTGHTPADEVRICPE